MSLAGYTTAVERSARGDLVMWVEIEGLPYAYGTHTKTSSWFASRAAGLQFEGIRSWMPVESIPTLPPQTLDHLEGAVSGGAMVVRIADVDGSLTEYTALDRSDGRCVFAAKLNASDTGAKTVSGDTSTWPASGTAYVGYETISYSSKSSNSVTISARGKYRSQASQHAGGNLSSTVAANGSSFIGLGDLLTPYPAKLEGRRVWLLAGHSPTTDADCTEVWSGIIEETSYEGQSLGTLVLSCAQGFGELKQPAFTDLGTFGTDAVEQGQEPVFVIASRTQSRGAGSFTAPETYVFGSYPNGIPVAILDTDNTPGKRRMMLTDGWALVELNADFDTQTSITGDYVPGVSYDAINAPRTPGGLLGSFVREAVLIRDGFQPFSAGAHPLEVLLQCLLSKLGDGANSATYDKLPPGFGLGIDASRVDVAGISEQIEASSSLVVDYTVTEPIEDFGAWARETLIKPFGFYLRPSMGNLISVGRMQPATPADRAAAVAITTADLIPGGVGQWTSDVQSIVGTVVWKSDRRPPPTRDGPFESRFSRPYRLFRDGRAIALDWPKARTIEVDGGVIPGLSVWEAGTVAVNAYLTQVAARFSRPVALLDLQVNLKHAVREVGELVSLTLDFVPSRLSATRGVSTALWEIVGKQVDYRRASVTLTLRQTSVSDLDTRYLAPAMTVASVAGNDVTITQADYVASGQNATDAFAVGDFVRVYTADDWYGRTTVREITAINGAVVSLDNAAGIGGTDVILHADYSDWDVSLSTAGSVIAFRATTDSVLIDTGSNEDAPHEMA